MTNLHSTKKGAWWIVLVSLMMLGCLLVGPLGNDALAAGNTIELKLVTYVPQGGGSIPEALAAFADGVKKRTNGKVTIKIFWSGSLAKITEIPGAVKSGLADMGSVVGFYHPEMFPYDFGASLDTMVLAGMKRGGWIKPYRKLYDEFPEVRNTFEKQNQRMIAFWEYDKVSILSTKPIRNLADAKGIKIRTSGKVLPSIYKAAGMIPVVIPSTDAYDAASRNMIDAIMATADQAISYRWYEPCKYFIEIPMFGTSLVYFLSINLDTWKKLPASEQKVISEEGEELTAAYPMRMESVDAKFRELFKKKGGEVITFSEDDQKVWKTRVAKPIFDDHIDQLGKNNVARGREIFERFAELIKYKP
ncbi:MAG: TRAP transporter substrate-binding protein DctP [Syntrophales bacterium]|jgi:TRAP-type C4-dicarboxylate transport system substrate-binding protein|nr:TRAP transporter substrate-binding protein DctP [Syntrophales bacterium]